MEKEFEKFILGQKGLLIRNKKCLILECYDKPNIWELPGGRIDQGESGEDAFKREINEELGFSSFESLSVVDYEVWYTTKSKKPICLVTNLIKNDLDEIKLSSEHSSLKWILEEEVELYEFVSPNMSRMIKSGFKYHKLLNK